MQPHEQRVIDEKEELDEKLAKLIAFTGASPIFASLPLADQELLCEQRTVMSRYSDILEQRIARFGL